MDKKTWKVWDSDIDEFVIKDFSDYYTLTTKRFYDFYYNEIFDWEFSDTKCIYEMKGCVLNENDLVVDLGSNIGLFTRYAAEKSNRVISIEGSPELFSCLVENLHDLKNVNFLNANVVSETNKESGTWSKNKTPINVTIKDIFYLYDLDYIDFLKIDIEGGEYSIFKDLSDTYLKRIKKIAIEAHDKNLNNELVNRIVASGKQSFYFNWYYGNEEPQTTLYFY